MAASTRSSGSRPIEQVQSIDARFGQRLMQGATADTFVNAIADFSVIYADKNERDYEAFTAAVKSGKLTAQTGI